MANTIINSPNTLNEGGNSGDYFQVNSGSITGTTVIGGTGKDTVYFGEPVPSAHNVQVSLAGGADSLRLSGVFFATGSDFKLGAGGDTITFASGDDAVGLIGLKGGAGSDVVNISAAADIGGTFALGAGADTFSGDAALSASGAAIKMGAGTDKVTFNATEFASGTVAGGGGNDTIVITASSVDDFTDAFIEGGGGDDTIRLVGTADSAVISLGDGNDTLTFSGVISDATGKAIGGAGTDSIDFGSAVLASVDGYTIGGGAGSDTITLAEFGSAGSGAVVLGGGGADSITITTNLAQNSASLVSAGAGFGTVMGGAGADSITFSADANGSVSAGVAAFISWSSNSDSTEAAMDVVTYTNALTAGTTFLIGLDATALAGNTTNVDNGLRISAGVLQSAGTNNSSIASRISALDANVATGKAAIFTDASGSAKYVFVQGGATDMVAKFSNTDTSGSELSAASITITEVNDGEYRIKI